MELITKAEKLADKSRELTNFQAFSLPDVKDNVAQILKLIGRDGIFSTYTLHDISHVDAMLGMLDWIIPKSTKDAMTCLDWLLIVLSTYLHDIGMVVAGDEFDKRDQNDRYRTFKNDILDNSENEDYIARTDEMTEEQKERFFFEEFIRKNHPKRVHDWITGQPSAYWGKDINPLAEAINTLLEKLPNNFRKDLATVCLSHHQDNLDDYDLFPLAQKYGNDTREIVNVQFAAIILRTVDLLHVTKDRTPSVMYKLIKFTDPKGVTEWDKQSEIFVVSFLGREFNEDDIKNHAIQIDANFTDEEPFFALSEYISYANDQINQTKRWADKSKGRTDAKDFSFPWHSVNGRILVEGHEPTKLNFELDRGKLLDLLVGHTIYNDPTVAIRELLQNAIDAVRFQRHLSRKNAIMYGNKAEPIGQVNVHWNSQTRELIIKDNGTGMDLDIIKNHLMRVGSSYYDTPKFQAENSDFSPISRFGIGILTCFMISDDIEIITRKDKQNHRIRMRSVHADYLLKEIKEGNPLLNNLDTHVTQVKLKLRNSVDLSKRSILDILKYWVILPECTVNYIEDQNQPISIGYLDIEDALNEIFLKTEGIKSRKENIELIKKETENATGNYLLAYATFKGLTPERSFLSSLAFNPPAVCLEGIRVSNTLPGFDVERGHRVSAILSVRNNKNFRTTVARDNLEIDDEYHKVSKICGDMLFKHIENEIERISNLQGNPLSQASTAGKWLVTALTRSFSLESLNNYIASKHEQLKIFVLEENFISKHEANRKLISLPELKAIDSFWTIESRLVNYLGIISRDLGKELTLKSFLNNLAPEMVNEKMNPIISDANQFEEIINKYFEIDTVEFGAKNKQTCLQWKVKSEDHIALIDNLENSFNKLIPLEKIREMPNYSEAHKLCYLNIDQDVFEPNKEYFRHYNLGFIVDILLSGSARNPKITLTKNIAGDIENIWIIRSDFGQIINENCTPGKTLKALQEALVLSEKNGKTTKEFVLLFLAYNLLKRMVFADEDTLSGYRDRIGQDIQAYQNTWSASIDKVNNIFSSLSIDLIVNEKLEEYIPKEDNKFSVQKYWMDWFKN